ncbi:Protein of unknown function (DUF1628) [Halovivax ruber XH-70]|uniref:Archaeal Type IV pilin N-terminal domain-containing protein n=1 Tax=Halovivax ruber (strain DSM 18193 / JCM 13892 / XH-70) TaxID=797302 RepID=L0IG11_HALRX|nr:type IV pilin N-terminal domain-containing protein [Halovivax ruber]AGB17166.1 Protein of unknown function (DUF1628) [Halovivax ruber XH-70]
MVRRPHTGRPRLRSISPVVGVIALVALTVCLGAVVAVGVSSVEIGAESPAFGFEATAESATDRIVLEHQHGDEIDVSTIDVVVTVDGEALAVQPPVPFFQEDGFRGGPSGPFNSRADSRWRVGERAGFRLASTNAPTIDPGDEIVVSIERDGNLLGQASTVAE